MSATSSARRRRSRASFLGRYVLAFEATSVLLLIAAVGGVTLAARRPAPREGGAVGAFEVERPEPTPSLQAQAVDAETRFDVVRSGSAPEKRGRRLMHVGVAWFLGVSAVLFGIGLYGVFTRRSPIILLLSVEIMLNSSNLALISFGRYWGDPAGQVFALVVMAVAASEVVVGLGLVVAMARRRADLDVDSLTGLRN